MLGSMYSAVSGLSAHQTKMNVIGNNIANVNTYGFKSSRAVFSDVFYQTLKGASGSTDGGSGGINPTQLGYGAKVGSIDVINTRAGSADTGRALDVYINGDGYLPVQGNDGTIKYTRVGNLKFDDAGYLTDYNGNKVLGLPINETTQLPVLDASGTTDVSNLVPIRLSNTESYSGIAIGESGEITAIRQGDPAFTPGPGTAWLNGKAVVDPESTYGGGVEITTTASPAVAFLAGKYSDGTAIPAAAFPTFPATANINGPISITCDSSTPPNVYTLTYQEKGSNTNKTVTGVETAAGSGIYTFAVDDTVNPAPATVNVTVNITSAGTNVTVPTNGDSLTLGTVVADSINIKAVTQDGGGNEVISNTTWTQPATTIPILPGLTLTVDPTKFGSLEDVADYNIGNVGPGAGIPEVLANLSTVSFANSDGLLQDGQGYYVESTSSGAASATKPGSDGTGTLRSNALEMSNVDLSKEFTEMIITQRGFQANTRMITVSDEMLNELVSMKR
ncbi:MAG TPA: flagellar hook-basal body complex protein [Anaerovoracaceae bacterium]|nr:flagellar hook-basal body complex protein [Anaerovoracaceae bacterium]